MTKLYQINVVFYLTCLSIINFPVSGKVESLLSRLYKKAQSSNRPLIVILDNSYLKERIKRPAQNEVNSLFTISDETHVEPSIFGTNLVRDPITAGAQKKRRPSTRPPNQRPIKRPKNIKKKKSFRARDTYDDVQKHDVRSPIVKSLLRISNDLRCDASDECKDICKQKFTGGKKRTCVVKCEIRYECRIEELDSCKGDECYIDSCDSGSCEEKTGSTKGYAMSDEGPRCKKGRC